MQDQNKREKAEEMIVPTAIHWRRLERKSIGSGTNEDKDRTYHALQQLRDECDRAGAADE